MSATLHILNSNSSGNGYVISTSDEQLILECGLPCDKALKVLNYDIKNVRCALASHSHHDHAGYIKQYQKYFKVYSTPDCAEKYNGVIALEPMKKIQIGGFKVMPLEVEHNVQCFAYVIDHDSFGRLAFFTDTRSFNYRIQNVSHIMCEVNYSDEVVIDNMMSGADVTSQFNNHMSLDTAIEVCRRLYNPRLQSVCAIHLSDRNADEKTILQRFKSELGINIQTAQKDTAIILQNEEF